VIRRDGRFITMAVPLAALVLLAVIAAAVTVVDAVRAPHWRVVAVERRRSRGELAEHDADHDATQDDEPLSPAGP
jgi:hypothetical protein